jgi:uncharacterized membrane protein YfcA
MITLVSLFTYFKGGCINLYYAVVFAVSSCIGTYLGTIYTVKKGEGIIERIFEIVVVIVSLKLMLC